MVKDIQFYKTDSIQEILYQLKNVKPLTIYSGGTSLLQIVENEYTLPLDKNCLFVNCQECSIIDKKERHIDFGTAVTLTQILLLGNTKIPQFFFEAIESVANPLIRNVATLVGNICTKNFYHTLYAPLLAVDAKLEIRNPLETHLIPLSKFSTLADDQIVTKIRFPLIDWDVAIFKRLGPSNEIIDVSASYTFLAKNQKDVLIDLRIAFCGPLKFRSLELENMLIGSRLPINKRAIEGMLDLANKLYDNTVSEYNGIIHPMLKSQFLNLLKTSLETLT